MNIPDHNQPDIIPWAKPILWGNEEAYVLEALRTTWISGGPFVERLEGDLAREIGCRHALAVCNGTAALHLAYIGLGLKPGDEIVVPAFAFMGAANVALQLGLTPVFCDVDPGTWCMRADDVAAVLTPRTRAIVAVHTYGNVCDVDALLSLGRDRGLPLIEDTAEALGSRIGGHMAGSLGAVNIFSFHATKTITTGEGGLVTTADDGLADRMRLWRSHGLRRKRHYWHEAPGHNFRLTNLQAALGCAQFEHFRRILAGRARVYAAYRDRLSSLPGLSLQAITPSCDAVIWAVALRLSPRAYPQGRDAVMAAMTERGIETRPGFQAPSQMSYFAPSHTPVSEELGAWVISLPTFPGLGEDDIERICRCLAQLAR